MICKWNVKWVGILEKKTLIYVEQLERTKDDGNIKVMSAQSVCDLIEIEVLAVQMKSVGTTNKR